MVSCNSSIIKEKWTKGNRIFEIGNPNIGKDFCGNQFRGYFIVVLIPPLLEQDEPMNRSGKNISFFFPSLKKVETPPFLPTNSCGTQALSITGGHCQLNCKHCGGRILQNMTAAETPIGLKGGSGADSR